MGRHQSVVRSQAGGVACQSAENSARKKKIATNVTIARITGEHRSLETEASTNPT